MDWRGDAFHPLSGHGVPQTLPPLGLTYTDGDEMRQCRFGGEMDIYVPHDDGWLEEDWRLAAPRLIFAPPPAVEKEREHDREFVAFRRTKSVHPLPSGEPFQRMSMMTSRRHLYSA